LAEFFSYLDSKIGLANVLIVLSADHGVAQFRRWSRPWDSAGGSHATRYQPP
jgi:hypothetical protein